MDSEKEILHLMNEYCFAIDSGDLAAFGSLFAHAEWIAEGKKPGKESVNNQIICGLFTRLLTFSNPLRMCK